jgi:hypothetical protein
MTNEITLRKMYKQKVYFFFSKKINQKYTNISKEKSITLSNYDNIALKYVEKNLLGLALTRRTGSTKIYKDHF